MKVKELISELQKLNQDMEVSAAMDFNISRVVVGADLDSTIKREGDVSEIEVMTNRIRLIIDNIGFSI